MGWSPLLWYLLLALSTTVILNDVQAQSNYVQQGDSGNYTTNGLPEEATLDGKVGCLRNRMSFL